jgi:hypothetical protein
VESSAVLLKYHPARTSQLCELTLMLMLLLMPMKTLLLVDTMCVCAA